MKKTLTFIKKHPWLLAKCLSFMAFVCVFLTKRLNSAMLFTINLKGYNPNPLPPPPPVPTPTLDKIWEHGKYIGVMPPYQPSWVVASLKDPYQHPVLKSRLAIAEKKKADEEKRIAKQQADEQEKLVSQQADEEKQITKEDLFPHILEETIVGTDSGDLK